MYAKKRCSAQLEGHYNKMAFVSNNGKTCASEPSLYILTVAAWKSTSDSNAAGRQPFHPLQDDTGCSKNKVLCPIH